MLDFDLGGVTSAGKPLPEGEYSFVIEEATIKPSKAGDSHNLRLRLTVTSENENGRSHLENLNMQEKTKPFVKAFLAALWGLDDDDIGAVNFDIADDGVVNSVNDSPLVGSEIGGTIKHVTSGESTYGNVNAWFTV